MASRKRNYTVRTGDTAATIAKQLGIDPQTLMQANSGVGNLRPGMVLNTPTPSYYGGAPGYPLDKMGGAMAYTPVDIPVPPKASSYSGDDIYDPIAYGQAPYVTSPNLSETQYPPGFTGYDVVPLVDARGKGVSDESMIGLGYTLRGSAWIREPTGATGAGGSGDVIPWTPRGGEVRTLEDAGGYPGQRKFSPLREGSTGETYKATDRYDAYGKLQSFAPAVVTKRSIGGKKGRREIRMKYGEGGLFKNEDYITWKREQKEGDDDDGGGAIGTAARSYSQQYGGYGEGGSYMPSVKKFARPNYLGLINWRI